MQDQDNRTHPHKDMPRADGHLPNIVLDGGIKVGNLPIGQIAGGAVIKGDGNTITILSYKDDDQLKEEYNINGNATNTTNFIKLNQDYFVFDNDYNQELNVYCGQTALMLGYDYDDVSNNGNAYLSDASVNPAGETIDSVFIINQPMYYDCFDQSLISPVGNIVSTTASQQGQAEQWSKFRHELLQEAQELIRKPKEILSNGEALNRIEEATKFNRDHLQKNMDQARHDSGLFFRVTLIFSVIGATVLIGGVGLMLAGFTAAGIVTTAAGLIQTAIIALFYKKDKELRNNIERFHTEILVSQRILNMTDFAKTLSETVRDSVGEKMLLKLMNVDPTQFPTRNEPNPRVQDS